MRHLEDTLQEGCVKWFRYAYPHVVIFAIPNGGSRNPIEAAKLKRTGTLAGVADLFVMKSKEYPDSKYPERYIHIWHGLFIELKVGKNTLSESQADFSALSQAAGYRYTICRSIDEFMNVVNEYLKP